MVIKDFLKNKLVHNAGWIIGEKIIYKLLAFFISLIMARYLGPGNYGLINYATAYTTFFASLCTLGINSVIVKDFVDHPAESGETIGTTLILRMISSVLSVGIIVGIVAIIESDEPMTILVVTLCSISLIFKVFDTFNYWFQSRLQSKYSAMANLIAYVVMSIYKVILVMQNKSIEWFAVSTSIDYIVIAVCLLWIYKKQKGPRFSFSLRKAKSLLSRSSSFIVSGLMVSIYASTDKLMLKKMLDENSVGYYSLAVTIAAMWTFVLNAIIDTAYPSIMKLHERNKVEYERRNKQLYAIVFYMSIGVSALISVMAEPLIRILYGEVYLPTVTSLRIIVWYTAFSYLGGARNAWIVCEEKQKFLKYIYAGSAGLNVLLNLIFIPIWGGAGAAGASLITQISTIFLFPMLVPSLRRNTKLILEAIMLKDVLPS